MVGTGRLPVRRDRRRGDVGADARLVLPPPDGRGLLSVAPSGRRLVGPGPTAGPVESPPAPPPAPPPTLPTTARKVLRFGVVSAVAVSATQLTLYLGYSTLGLPAAVANVVAVCVGAVPAYLLSRRWVWAKRTPHSVAAEIVPFWAYNLAGLAASTVVVAVVAARDDAAVAVHVANLTTFAALWLGKFALLDRVLFAQPAGPPIGPPIGPPTGPPDAG
ncbi:MAG TPA: hypothetical protein DEP66_01030 [Acidimicrobiaceae bacterium]|nr:hypothetical protein [Acidimicrobiaceae bacterium]